MLEYGVGKVLFVVLTGFVSAWRQDCSGAGECAVPVAVKSDEAVSVRLDVPSAPGEARTARVKKEYAFGANGEKVAATFTFYYLCPKDAVNDAWNDPCPTRYVQAQVALSGDARGFCAASLNPADAVPFPVLMCAGENARRPGERLGLSLHRKPVAPRQ